MVPKNIKKACGLAKKPGECIYYEGDSPCCVIGQLHFIEKEKIVLTEGTTVFDNYKTVKCFQKYDIDKLNKLQEFWDKSHAHTNEELLEEAEKIWE